jgi:hypothetical protein
MFSQFSPQELQLLTDSNSSVCLSLYMPTHPAGHERQQDAIRLKNLVRAAERQLDDRKTPPELRDKLVAPLANLTNDRDAWPHRRSSIASFSAENIFRSYTFSASCPELIVAGERFHIGPLLPLLAANREYFLLALTKDSANLYEASQHSLDAIELPELEPIQVDGNERPMQQHAHHAPTQGRGATGETIHHGQGGPDEREKTDIQNFFKRQVEPAVADALKGHSAPLVLACVDYLAALYRDANSYPHLVDKHVTGSPAELDQESLRDRAWDVAAPLLLDRERAAIDAYHRSAGGDLASPDPAVILDAARAGRVGTLLLRNDALQQGADEPAAAAKADPSPSPALHDTIIQTLLHGGEVLALDEVPGHSPLAAVFRY